MVAVAENTADELARSDGRDVQLQEDPDLQLPFLLPEDGYSCDVVRNIPSGLQEFLDPLCQRGGCRPWTVAGWRGPFPSYVFLRGSPLALSVPHVLLKTSGVHRLGVSLHGDVGS